MREAKLNRNGSDASIISIIINSLLLPSSLSKYINLKDLLPFIKQNNLINT